jgi:hypothetical protein
MRNTFVALDAERVDARARAVRAFGIDPADPHKLPSSASPNGERSVSEPPSRTRRVPAEHPSLFQGRLLDARGLALTVSTTPPPLVDGPEAAKVA